MSAIEKQDEKLIVSATEATGLLKNDTEYVHNFVNDRVNFFIGCDYSRDDAVKAFREAKQIEIAGPHARAMGHPLAVLDNSGRLSFFEADMEKVAAFEVGGRP